MASIATSDIKHDGIRELMERCASAMAEDRFDDAVRAAADAYLLTLEDFPAVREVLQTVLDNEQVSAGLAVGSIRNAPLMWPRYGAKLHLEGAAPEITLDRKQLSFVEAVNYQEFTLGLIHDVETGNFSVDPSKIRPGL